MDICIDFDGTCVTHEFPKVGKDIGAVPVLKQLVANGHNLILFTMRSNKNDNTGFAACTPEIHNGNFLDDAINWFKENDIPLHGIQTNPQQKEWTTSPKAYGQLYIDDAALGAPLKREICHKIIEVVHDGESCTSCDGHGYVGRPYICWDTVKTYLIETKIIKLL